MSVPAPSDADLVIAIANRQDRAALAELCRRFGGRLRAFATARGASGADADELVQEILVSVWSKAARYDPDRASVGTWVFTIARNKTIDRLRRHRRADVDPSDPALVPALVPARLRPPDEVVSRAAALGRIRTAMEILPVEQSSVVRAMYSDGLSLSEIAARENLPLGTVKSRARLAMQALRRQLSPEEDPR